MRRPICVWDLRFWTLFQDVLGVSTALPDDAEVDTSGLDSQAENREALFKLGYDGVASGKAWREPSTPFELPPMEH